MLSKIKILFHKKTFSHFFLYVFFYFSKPQDKLGVTSQGDFFRRVSGSQTPKTSIIYTTPYLAGNFLYIHSHICSITNRCLRNEPALLPRTWRGRWTGLECSARKSNLLTMLLIVSCQDTKYLPVSLSCSKI